MKIHAKSIWLPLLLAITLLTACDTFKQEDETVTYFENKFEVLKPGSWKTNVDLNDEADLQMGNMFKEAYAVFFTEPTVDFDPTFDLQAYANMTKGFIVDSLTATNEQPQRELTINGFDAIQSEFTGTIDGIRIQYWHTVIATPAHFHQVILWSLPSKFADNEADYTRVLNSFNIAKTVQ